MKNMEYWKLTTRGGRRIPVSDVRRPEKLNDLAEEYVPKLKRVKMVQEGALLTSDISGQVKDISEPNLESNHVRSGKGISIPVHPNLHAIGKL